MGQVPYNLCDSVGTVSTQGCWNFLLGRDDVVSEKEIEISTAGGPVRSRSKSRAWTLSSPG